VGLLEKVAESIEGYRRARAVAMSLPIASRSCSMRLRRAISALSSSLIPGVPRSVTRAAPLVIGSPRRVRIGLPGTGDDLIMRTGF
jgi:hypothetical protein